MTEPTSGVMASTSGAVVREKREEEVARAARAMGQAEAEVGVVIREILLDAIEPDPAQPRRVFDEGRLRSLAASIRKYGVLQEPGVVPVAGDAGGEPRYRIVWGERRWRASRLVGLTSIRCKVLPSAEGSAVERLRTKEQQWAENMEREGLSPIEEAIAVQEAVDLEQMLHPEAFAGELVEKVGAGRGLNGMVARNLVALLKTPRSLQSAVMSRAVGREVAFELTRIWNRLLSDNELRGAAKREIQYRNLVEAWARARGADLDAQAMARYAAETFQDPKVVKTTCRKAEDSQSEVLERFDALVARAQKEAWTVERARSEVAGIRRKAGGKGASRPQCFERSGKEKSRLVVHLDRVRDAEVATPEALASLLSVLQDVTQEVESRRMAALGGQHGG